MAAHPGQAQHEHPHQSGPQGPVDPGAVESALRRRSPSGWVNRGLGSGLARGCGWGSAVMAAALEVQVPSAFFREWIKNHFADSLTEAAQSVAGRPVRLTFAIQDEAEPPLGDVVEPDADRFNRQPGPAVTVPLPGNPKTPLTSPAPLPVSPDRFSPSRFDAPPSDGARDESLPRRQAAGPMPRRIRRLDDFVTGPGNRLAHAAAREMAQTAGSAFNPLVIHGGVGLGKTHLLEAIGHGLRQAHPGLNVLLITAEAFTNSFLDAMRTGTLSIVPRPLSRRRGTDRR